MPSIKILSENLVNQIAAGEVIERPASAIKELIENSLDSGANNIIVDIKDGGKLLISVSDNGCGMNEEDLKLSIQRHATSKISKEADLWNISTMGFRGEALASICSIAKLTIKTRQKGTDFGIQLDCEGSEISNISKCAMSEGTYVIAKDLFYNTPARQKYLKQTSTELSHITSVFNTIALSNPNVSFKLIHNDKIVSDLPKTTDLISRISDIFGKATSEAMFEIFYGGSDFKIQGFVGKPAISRSTNSYQYFFVNNRPIQHFVLANAIREAFSSMLMENKKPVFIINITIDPSLIDVNVHPRKIEIRFEDQQSIIKTMYGCVKSAIEKTNLTPLGFTESKRYMNDKFPEDFSKSSNFYREKNVNSSFDFKPHQGLVNDALSFTKEFSEKREISGIENIDIPLRAVSQIFNAYIVAQSDEGIVLIDQHAAHERVRFEQLMDQFSKQEKSIQSLILPLEIEMSNSEHILISENINIFENLGFEISDFGGKSFVINAIPAFLVNEDVDVVIKGVLDDITNEKSPTKFQGKKEMIINYMACRSAIKFGKSLSLSEMQALIAQLDKLKMPYTCPHGRPTMVKFTKDELDKMFGRK
ncbi:MAG: DNA mismatch repair endonuclease MutL [Candidatus Gracilibacteria bacterium]|jgi:DNA mismatch repair protein MutL